MNLAYHKSWLFCAAGTDSHPDTFPSGALEFADACELPPETIESPQTDFRDRRVLTEALLLLVVPPGHRYEKFSDSSGGRDTFVVRSTSAKNPLGPSMNALT